MEAVARPDLLAVMVHLAGTVVFAAVVLFLYRESHIIYFGYWASAWALLAAALFSNLASLLTGRPILLYPYALLELAFTASVFFAAASVFGRFDLRVSWAALLVPVALALGYAAGAMSDFHGFYALDSLLLTAAYGWNFVAFRRRWKTGKGTGRKLFSAALLVSSLLYSHYALMYASAHLANASLVPAYLRYQDLYDLVLETLLAFSAMMMWMETQNEQLEQLNHELTQSRLEIAASARIDPLTGLLNRASLDQACESPEQFSGTVIVADLDNFKDVNDVLGHLAGDEVLANVGNLIKSSMRREDHAWRWGGDEFVLLFRDQSLESVEQRMQTIQEKLLRFRIRGKGVLPIRLSWGAAELNGRSLRETLEDADHHMYSRKRDKLSAAKFFGTA